MPLLVLDPVRSLLVSQGLTAPDPGNKVSEPIRPVPDKVETETKVETDSKADTETKEKSE
jgi:hypothetical protein